MNLNLADKSVIVPGGTPNIRPTLPPSFTRHGPTPSGRRGPTATRSHPRSRDMGKARQGEEAQPQRALIHVQATWSERLREEAEPQPEVIHGKVTQ